MSVTAFSKRIATVTVNTNVGTKQVLYTVPADRHFIPLAIVVRSAGASLATISGSLVFGFDAGATDFNATATQVLLAKLTSASKAIYVSGGATNEVNVGAAGAVFGCKFNGTNLTTTVIIDIYGVLTAP